MMEKRQFTLIELLVVIAILGALVAALAGGLSSAMGKKDSMVCKTNLKQLGTGMIAYSLDMNYFPCGVKDTDSDSTISKRKRETGRSTLRTFKTFKEFDNEEITNDRFFCPSSGANVPRTTTTPLGRDNVGYHYVNGDVSTRVLKSNLALVRDLNEGHDDAKEGNVVYASGAVTVIKKLGLTVGSDKLNYRTNWYKNKNSFVNYRSFDNYGKKISRSRQDRAD